jgi:hypothetical protein
VTEQTSFAVLALWIYPTKDEPGISLATVEVEAEGLAGDRRKKSALHLVCATDAAELAPRANLVLDATAEQLAELVGHQLTLGNSQIEITGKPSNCPASMRRWSDLGPSILATDSNRRPGNIRTRSPMQLTDPVPPSRAAYPHQRAGANRVFAVVRHRRGHRWNEAIGRGGDDGR